MNRQFALTIVLPATLAVVFSATAESSHAGLLDWLFPRRRARRQSYLVTQYPVSCGNTSACGMGAAQPPLTAQFTPQTSYRTVWAPVPVTTYRPAAGCAQPCTSYTWQARRVPYVSFQPALGQVSPYGRCGSGGCATGVCPSGTCGNALSYRPSVTTAGYATTSYATPWVSTGMTGASYDQPTALGYANGSAFSPSAGCRGCDAASSGVPLTGAPAPMNDVPGGFGESPAGGSEWQTVPPTDAGGAAGERPRLQQRPQGETPNGSSLPAANGDGPASVDGTRPPAVFREPRFIPTKEARHEDAYAAYRSELTRQTPADPESPPPAPDLPDASHSQSFLQPIPDLERDLPAWQDHESPQSIRPPDRTASADRWQATPVSWELPQHDRGAAESPIDNVSADFWDQSGWSSAANGS